VPGQSARVYAFYAQNPFFLEIIGQGGGGAKITGHGIVFLDQKGLRLNPGRFHVLGIHAIIADQRIGHGHNLARIGGIGKDFLIAGHRGVEYYFSGSLTRSGKGSSLKNSAVFQSNECFHAIYLNCCLLFIGFT
jgi:hypothetical protein